MECSYQMSIARESEIYQKMETLLKTHTQLDAKLTAKIFLKMGNWMREKVYFIDETCS